MDIYPTKDTYKQELKRLLGFVDVKKLRKKFPKLRALPATRTDFWRKAVQYAKEAIARTDIIKEN